MPFPPSEIERLTDLQRARLLARDQAAMDALVRAWEGVESAVERDMLVAAERARLRGYTSPADLHNDRRYRDLLAQVRAELTRYGHDATDTITDAQRDAARAGLTDAQDAIAAQYDGRFSRLPIEAVTNLVGILGDGAPLREVLVDIDPRIDDRLAQSLINGVARGKNPHAIADEMGTVFGTELLRFLTIARTESIRAYNTASQQQYKDSGIVTGWQRRETKDRRCCTACLVMDGTVYPVDTAWHDHVNGRGTMVPVLDRVPPRQTAWEWFETLDEVTQRDILGDRRFELWVGGYTPTAFARTTTDPIWGASLGVTPLRDLV
ncbi:MAG: hypothetical protein E6Q97_30005 [Desulfurellales bacterium]|nr:MAG: hypothetical protein E6Q97_30005 [Desulfurellales bacterium]